MSLKLDTPIKAITGGASAAARSRRLKVVSYLILGFLAIFYLWPLLMLISTSLKPLNEYLKDPAGLPTAPTLANYAEAWELANFPRYLLNSALYTATATAIFIVSSLFVAFPIARDYFKGSNIILTLYVIALFLPPALIPQFQLILNLGLYNTRAGYILLFLINPIGLIILVNYIKSIPRELDESAAVDGCGYFRFVLTVLMPLIRPAVATVVVLHAIGVWNQIIAPTTWNFSPRDHLGIPGVLEQALGARRCSLQQFAQLRCRDDPGFVVAP